MSSLPEHDSALVPSLLPLEPLIGRWRTTGAALDRTGRVAAEIVGHDSWTVLPGGRWIAHQSAARVGDQISYLHQVIGGEHPEGGWRMLAFEEGPMPEMNQLRRTGAATWEILGESVRADFVVDPAAGRSMRARWERRTAAGWSPWLEIDYVAER